MVTVTTVNSTDGGLEGGGEDDFAVSAAAPPKPYEVDHDRLAAMYQKISEDPRLLTPAAGRPTCCIFRVPESLVEVNGKSYRPHIVSIGPYHRGDPQLQMIQEHKWRYLGALLARLQNQQLLLEDLMAAVAPLVASARECYSEIIPLDADDFIEMMVLDGCFMIELFRKTKHLVAFEHHDPLVTMVWIFPFFYRDFLRLENQIPYFVLERLYEFTTMPGIESQYTLAELALDFFNNAMQRSDEDIAIYRHITGNHLLDLPTVTLLPTNDQVFRSLPKTSNHPKFADDYESRSNGSNWSLLAPIRTKDGPVQRSEPTIGWLHKDLGGNRKNSGWSEKMVRESYMPRGILLVDQPRGEVPTHVIQSVSKLRRAGIRLSRSKQESFLVVKFSRGVIEMPSIVIDDFMTSFLQNCVAYEQCHHSSSKHITTYATLLDCLVNTYRDVEYLCDRNIIENYFGTDTEVATFINNLGKDMAFDIDRCYLVRVFNDVHEYYCDSWHVQWASFKYTYFDTPWSFVSALAALVLLLLTVTQTYFTIHSAFNNNNNNG